jgi:GNAT superfamily N-acetyltransferase
MEVRLESPAAASAVDLPEIAALLDVVFRKERNKDRNWQADLAWQYVQNPCGPALYVNARSDEGKLVGHYAVIPVPPFQDQRFRHLRPFLSLNTAVHPDAQGKGIFKATAARLYAHLQSLQPSVVLGVANANSVNGFLRSLSFSSLGELALRFFFPWQTPKDDRLRLLEVDAGFLQWRSQRPSCEYRAIPDAGALSRIIRHKRIPVEGLLSTKLAPELLRALPADQQLRKRFLGPPRLYASSGEARGGIPVPQRFRPSPLHLICRVLADEDPAPLLEHVRGRLFEFLDFDVM